MCGEMRDRPLHYPTRPPCVHTLQRSNTVSRAAMLVRPRRAKGAHHSSSGSYLEEIHWVPYDTSPPSECCGVESGRAPSSEPPGAGGETISYTLSTIKRTDALGVQEKEPKSRPQGRSSCFRSSRLGCRVGLHHLSQDTGSADPHVLAISLQDRRTPPTPRMSPPPMEIEDGGGGPPPSPRTVPSVWCRAGVPTRPPQACPPQKTLRLARSRRT